jgi:hypothetical protein
MPISAAFTVNGASNPAEHTTTYGAVVSLALASIVGAEVITWQILAASDPTFTIPAITTGGTPPASTAQFTFPADPGDTIGRAFIIRCTVSNANETAVQTAIVGVLNVNGALPLCPGEEFERHATHGWGPTLNRFLATIGGSPIGPASGDLGGTFPMPHVHALTGTAGVVTMRGNALRWVEGATPSLSQAARTTDAATNDTTITSQAPFALATLASRNPGNIVLAISSPAAGGSPGFVRASISGTVTHALGVYPTDTTYGAMWLGATAPSSSNYAIAGKTGAATHLNATTLVGFNIADSAVGNIRAAGLRLGDGSAAAERLDVSGNATVLGFARAGVLAAKAYLDSYGAFGATVAAVWLGAITPGLTNAAVAGDGTTTTVNAITRAQVAAGGTVHSVFTSSGLRIGSTSDPTERLEVVGNALVLGRGRFGAATGYVFADNLPGSTTTFGGIWMGNITPSSTNFTLSSNGSTSATFNLLATSNVTLTSTYVQVTAPNSANGFIAAADFTRFRSSDSSTTHGVISTAGLRIGDGTTATEKLDVVGRAKFGVGAAKVIADSDPSFPASDADLWIGAIVTPSASNYTLRSDGTTVTILNSAGTLRFRTANTGRGIWSSTGLRVGDESSPTNQFEAIGTSRFGTSTGYVHLANLVGSVATHGAIYFGNITPSGTNYTLFANGLNDVRLNSPGNIDFTIGSSTGRMRVDFNGVKIGSLAAPSERLDVAGNICFDATTTTPRIYQRDNTTVSSTGQTFTIQAANSTAATSIGATLDLRSGTGTTRAGDVTLSYGAAVMGGFSSRVLAMTMHVGAPTSANYVFASGGAVSIYNAISSGHEFRVANATIGSWTSTGLRVGDATTPTNQFEAIGTSRFGTSTGYVFLANLVGSTTTHGAIYFGNITPSGTNYTFFGNGLNDTRVNSGGNIDFTIGSSTGRMRVDINGVKIGAASSPGAPLDVAGNIIGSGTLTLSGVIASGTTPAASGQIRLPHNTGIHFRNSGNTADIAAIQVNTNDILLGSADRLTRLQGGQVVQTRAISSNTTLDTSSTMDTCVYVDATSGVIAVTLPTPIVGRRIKIVRTAGSNDVETTPASTHTVNGINAATGTWNLITDPITGTLWPYIEVEGISTTAWAIVDHHSIQFTE